MIVRKIFPSPGMRSERPGPEQSTGNGKSRKQRRAKTGQQILPGSKDEEREIFQSPFLSFVPV